MRSLRNAHPLMHLALAALFAVMSLAHGPLMSFARANTVTPHHTTGAAVPDSGHHHHIQAGGLHQPAHVDDQPDADVAVIPAPCFAIGCFVALPAAQIGAPLAGAMPLEQLAPALARVMVPAEPDPAVPPPRLPA
jgi:hypothetical protein